MAEVNDVDGSCNLLLVLVTKDYTGHSGILFQNTGVNRMSNSYDIYPCSNLKRSRMCLPYLPKDIIFNILLCLPVGITYNFIRYVYREWYNITRDPVFVDAHLQKSPRGISIQSHYGFYPTVYVETGKLGVDPQEGLGSETDFKWFRYPSSQRLMREMQVYDSRTLKFPGKVLASCNGLILLDDRKHRNCLHIANIVSKQCVLL